MKIMTELVFLQDIATVMAISAGIMILCQRFHLPVVLGYILAGVVIGPHTLPFPLIRELHHIHTLSELGVIFLLFSIGLEFSLSRLMRVGIVAIFAATLEIILMIWIGYLLGGWFGWNFMNSLFLGAILSISSTTIIAKVLIETKRIKEKFAQVILGILVIEDLLAIVIIALLSGVASTGSLELREVGVAMIRVFSFVGGVLFLGFLLVPRLLRYISQWDHSEMMVITVLGLCFGVSLLAAKFGFSVALGAFLIGAVIAETKQVDQIIHKIESIRDMFTAIFFVSVGMLLSPPEVMRYWQPILIIALVTIVGKVFSCSLGAFLTGYKSDTALKVGLGLAQIGEFSFIIARLGETTNVTSPFIFPIAVSVSCITTLTTPVLMKQTESIIKLIHWMTPKPLATYLGLYTGWLGKMREVKSERKLLILKGLRFYLPRLFFYGVGALILLYGISTLQEKWQFLPPNFYWLLLGVMMLPLFIGFAYTLDQILWDVLFLNLVKSRAESDPGRMSYQALHHSLRFVMVMITGFLFLAIGASFFPRMPVLLAWGGLTVISVIYLWGFMRRVHERIENLVLGIFETEQVGKPKQANQAQFQLEKLIREEYPWEVSTQDFLLPYKDCAANQLIRDLRLRSETGATIVAIYRNEESMPNPAPETRLLPGDVLLLMGDPDQIKNAVRFLNEKIKEPPSVKKDESSAKTQLFKVLPQSEFIGKTLRETRLRRKTGVTILGVQKAEMAINNPDPDTILEAGDVLILFGFPDQLHLAEICLSQS